MELPLWEKSVGSLELPDSSRLTLRTSMLMSPRAGTAGTAVPAPLHPEGYTPWAALTAKRIFF